MTDQSVPKVRMKRRIETFCVVSFWLAIVSLMLGLSSLVAQILAMAGIPSLVAVVLGLVGIRRATRSPDRWRGARFGKVGAIIGIIGVVLSLWMVVELLRNGSWGSQIVPTIMRPGQP